MDYTELLAQHCPAPAAQHVLRNRQLTSPKDYWLPSDSAGFDLSAECHLAALGVTTKGVSEQSLDLWLNALVYEVQRYLPMSQDPVLWERTGDAMARILTQETLPHGFFPALMATRIDLREAVTRRFPDWPAAGGTLGPDNRQARLRVIYLAVMEEPGALAILEAEAARIIGPRMMMEFLRELDEYKVPGGARIVQSYIDDTRQTTMVHGSPGAVVANTARGILGLAPHPGPYDLVNEAGASIPAVVNPRDPVLLKRPASE
ncbi:hypothetical protein IV417_12030 [Alphaproteobacteria bacterium KMM 3653]|uniref:Uncharacterized protein n=1 Tax=Harenicola maris TaxID=2841044 RepID=A0AAP2CPC1_9RHOB|nr:hypothetical protein [Harenicola maris]